MTDVIDNSKMNEAEENKIKDDETVPSTMPHIKELWPSTKRLLKNKILLFRIISGIFTWIALDGYSMVLPKYFEKRFSMTASEASAWAGLAFLVPFAAGKLVVGFVLQKTRPPARQFIVAIIVAKIIYSILLVTLVSLKCETSHIYGAENGARFPACNTECECSPNEFNPVCSEEGLNYFSPCHAGCSSAVYDNTTFELKSYSKCACVENEGTAFPKQCDANCNANIIYIIVAGIGHFILSIEIIGSIIMYLRCVDVKDKTYAIGLGSAIWGLFAFIPCPMIFSSAVDQACEVWGSQCGEEGACLVYNADHLGWIVNLMPAGFITLACFWDGMFWLKAKDLQIFDKEEKEDNTGNRTEQENLHKNGKL